jgi:hypothetical protein
LDDLQMARIAAFVLQCCNFLSFFSNRMWSSIPIHSCLLFQARRRLGGGMKTTNLASMLVAVSNGSDRECLELPPRPHRQFRPLILSLRGVFNADVCVKIMLYLHVWMLMPSEFLESGDSTEVKWHISKCWFAILDRSATIRATLFLSTTLRVARHVFVHRAIRAAVSTSNIAVSSPLISFRKSTQIRRHSTPT